MCHLYDGHSQYYKFFQLIFLFQFLNILFYLFLFNIIQRWMIDFRTPIKSDVVQSHDFSGLCSSSGLERLTKQYHTPSRTARSRSFFFFLLAGSVSPFPSSTALPLGKEEKGHDLAGNNKNYHLLRPCRCRGFKVLTGILFFFFSFLLLFFSGSREVRRVLLRRALDLRRPSRSSPSP